MSEAKTLQNLKEFKGLVLRADVVSFMEVNNLYYRMKGFTDLPTSKETEEYSRKYVDEKSERTSVTGMTSTTDFTLDRYKDNPVHGRIQEVFDKEQLADDATVNIVVVDFAKPIEGQEGKYYAIKRNHTIVPDSAGDGTDAYQYSGSFKANGPSIEGYAELGENDNDWLTIKFTEGAAETAPESGTEESETM